VVLRSERGASRWSAMDIAVYRPKIILDLTGTGLLMEAATARKRCQTVQDRIVLVALPCGRGFHEKAVPVKPKLFFGR
jgi:hypothetical protein